MIKLRWLALAGAVVLMVACRPAVHDVELETLARAVYEEVRTGDQAALETKLSPALRTPQARADLAQFRGLIPQGPARSARVVGLQTITMPDHARHATVSVEYDYGDRVALAQTGLYKPNGGKAWQVGGFHVNVAFAKALAANDFTLMGKRPAQYGFLLYAIASPLLMLAALIRVVATPGLRFKWLWGVLAFVGVSMFRMNWTTGALSAQWLAVEFIGSGVVPAESRFAPWLITATLPVGALLILAGLWARPRKPAP